MENKLLILKSKFYMSAEDRKKLSDDIHSMIKNGAVVLGDEIEQMSIMNLENGSIIPIYNKQNKKDEETKSKNEFTTLEKLFSKSNSEK